MVPALDPGIEIFVRNKRPADMDSFRPARTVLFVHGATYPAHTNFDLPLDGVSWMDTIAARGYDVYLLDVRGYGKSTRPKEMAEAPDSNPPIVRTATAVKDISAVVDFILKRRNIPRLVLLGWSWGTFSIADLRDRKSRQGRAAGALCADLDPPDRPAGRRPDRRPHRRLSHRHPRAGACALEQRRARGQEGDADPARRISMPGWTRPGPPIRRRQQNPPVIRAPNGVMQDVPKPGGPASPITIRRKSPRRRCWSRPPGTTTCRR